MTTPFSGLLLNLGLGLSLGAGLVYSAKIVTTSMERQKGTIEVKGYAEKDLKSDFAQWVVTVKSTEPGRKEAYSTLDAAKQKVMAYLKEKFPENANIKPENIDIIENVRLTEQGFTTTEVVSYTVSQRITISSRDLQNIQSVSLKINELAAEGVNVVSSAPQYFMDRDKLELAKVELLSKATASAKQRADQFATNSGTKIGRLVSARQGVFQIAGDAPSDTSVDNNQGYSQYDTLSINKVLKIAVTLSYTTGE